MIGKSCEKNKCPFRKRYGTCGYCHKQNGKFEGYPEKETKIWLKRI